jgi:hypothetical protein
MDRAWRGNDASRALELVSIAVKHTPNDPIARYDAGVIKWSLRGDGSVVGGIAGALTWQEELDAFFKLLPNNRGGVNPRAIEIAQDMLQGRAQGRLPLMVPND